MSNNSHRHIILVTGGSGYLGSHLIEKLLHKYGNYQIRFLSTSESNTERLMRRCSNNRLDKVVGDIRDVDIVRFALRNVSDVIHLAAIKHIDLCEVDPPAAITTNVI